MYMPRILHFSAFIIPTEAMFMQELATGEDVEWKIEVMGTHTFTGWG